MVDKTKLPIVLILFFSAFLLLTPSFGTCSVVPADNRATFHGKLENIEKKVKKEGVKQTKKIVIKVSGKYFYITSNAFELLKQAEKLQDKEVEVFYDKTNNHVISIYQYIQEDDPS